VGSSADGSPGDDNEFKLKRSGPAGRAGPVHASKIESTRTEAAMKFTVVDRDKGPIMGIVISMTAPDGKKYYTGETDADGYAEVLVPVGKKYDLVYLSLGRKNITARVPVSNESRQTIRLTLRYKRRPSLPRPEGQPADAPAVPERFVLKGVHFDTGKSKLRKESFERLDTIVEFMAHKKSARIEVSGHSDNVGNPKRNKALSKKRAQACRDYLISKGIDGSRIVAVGHGVEQPIASNDTEEGRQKNRRIEATEL